jgi:hypothetical protein
MDNKTRAEKIWRLLAEPISGTVSEMKRNEIDYITSQLDEAVSAALKDREIAYEKDFQMRFQQQCDLWKKRAEKLYKTGKNIEDILEVPGYLGMTSHLVMEKAIKDFKETLAEFEGGK